MGDLTFIHDSTGLIIGPGEPRPSSLRIVVANDDGGGIFGLLEQGDPRLDSGALSGAYERVFGTPHRTDLAALCAGMRVAHRRVSLGELSGVLGEELAAEAGGIEVVEVRVRRHDRRALDERIRDDHPRPPLRMNSR